MRHGVILEEEQKKISFFSHTCRTAKTARTGDIDCHKENKKKRTIKNKCQLIFRLEYLILFIFDIYISIYFIVDLLLNKHEVKRCIQENISMKKSLSKVNKVQCDQARSMVFSVVH